jgi:hypothetical protein
MDVFQAPASGVPAEAGTPEEIARFVVGAAVHAPSVHNTQPWWFGHAGQEISVHADTERRLRVADPHGREMMISCGAALFNIRVALRYLGLVPVGVPKGTYAEGSSRAPVPSWAAMVPRTGPTGEPLTGSAGCWRQWEWTTTSRSTPTPATRSATITPAPVTVLPSSSW